MLFLHQALLVVAVVIIIYSINTNVDNITPTTTTTTMPQNVIIKTFIHSFTLTLHIHSFWNSNLAIFLTFYCVLYCYILLYYVDQQQPKLEQQQYSTTTTNSWTIDSYHFECVQMLSNVISVSSEVVQLYGTSSSSSSQSANHESEQSLHHGNSVEAGMFVISQYLTIILTFTYCLLYIIMLWCPGNVVSKISTFMVQAHKSIS